MKNVSGKSRRENQNTHFMFNNFFFQNCPIYETMWKKSILEWVRPQMTVWPMHIACWIPRATNTHSGSVILMLQQWLHNCPSMLRYTYIASIALTLAQVLHVIIVLFSQFTLVCILENWKPCFRKKECI